MVFLHTSNNIRMLKNLVDDFNATKETSAYEYIKAYIVNCPEDNEDAKLSWIAETFLGIQKHESFLRKIADHLSKELSEEEQDFFIILLHALIFQISEKDRNLLYKCMFNLSKQLLNILTKFLSNNEVLSFISDVAQEDYDTNYITEKIIGPIFNWQPYISEMAHDYEKYLKKNENKKIIPTTVPIQPNVMKRKPKEPLNTLNPQSSFPTTPPNSIRPKSKLLTRSAIDRRLNKTHEKNKQRAANLLETVKKQDFHYLKHGSEKRTSINEKNDSDISKYNNIMNNTPKHKPKFSIKVASVCVKETATTIRRMNRRIQIAEQNEVKWLEEIMSEYRNVVKVDELEEFDRQEKERLRLLDIERNHLMGQISHEEAVIAKKRVIEDNKKKYAEFLKEKELWNEQIENWKKEQVENCRKQIEKLSMLELNAIEAKNAYIEKRKEIAESIRKESEDRIAAAIKARQDELERKITMIREIKVLAIIAKKARAPKILNLTETAGIGLLCEMSMAELQEKLTAMKIGIKEELQKKKEMIKEENETAKQALDEVKEAVKTYIAEREVARKIENNNKIRNASEIPPSQEIIDLKNILAKKRKLRMKLTN